MLLLIVILIVITLGKLDNTKVPSGLLKGLLHVCEKCLYVQSKTIFSDYIALEAFLAFPK